MPDRIRRLRHFTRFGWTLDPTDNQWFIKNEEEQELLDKAAEFLLNGSASWSDVALMLSLGTDKEVQKSSAVVIVQRERPEVLNANREI